MAKRVKKMIKNKSKIDNSVSTIKVKNAKKKEIRKSKKAPIPKESKKLNKTHSSKTKKVNYMNFENITIPCFLSTIKYIKSLTVTNLILISSLDTIALLSYNPLNASKEKGENGCDSRFKIESYGYISNDKIDKIYELQNGWLVIASKQRLNIYEIDPKTKSLLVVYSYIYENESHSLNLFQLKDGTLINSKVNSISKFSVDIKNKKFKMIEEFPLPVNQSEKEQFYDSLYIQELNYLYHFYGVITYVYSLGNSVDKINLLLIHTLKGSRKIKNDAEGKLFFKPFLINSGNDLKILYYCDKSIILLDPKTLKIICSKNMKNKIMYVKPLKKNDYVAIGDKSGSIFIYMLHSNKFQKIKEFSFSDTSILSINELEGDRLISYADHNRFAIFNYITGKLEILQSVQKSKDMRRGLILCDGSYLTGCSSGFLLIH